MLANEVCLLALELKGDFLTSLWIPVSFLNFHRHNFIFNEQLLSRQHHLMTVQ